LASISPGFWRTAPLFVVDCWGVDFRLDWARRGEIAPNVSPKTSAAFIHTETLREILGWNMKLFLPWEIDSGEQGKRIDEDSAGKKFDREPLPYPEVSCRNRNR
jgi:hypothetical protein